MRQHFKRGIALLFIASSISLNAQTMHKVRVINQDTGEPVMWASNLKTSRHKAYRISLQ